MSNKNIEVTEEQAQKIIESRTKQSKDRETYSTKDLGTFYYYDKNRDIWVGIDNSTGEAWVEEFQTRELCFAWLDNEFEISDSLDKDFSLDQIRKRKSKGYTNVKRSSKKYIVLLSGENIRDAQIYQGDKKDINDSEEWYDVNLNEISLGVYETCDIDYDVNYLLKGIAETGNYPLEDLSALPLYSDVPIKYKNK